MWLTTNKRASNYGRKFEFHHIPNTVWPHRTWYSGKKCSQQKVKGGPWTFHSLSSWFNFFIFQNFRIAKFFCYTPSHISETMWSTMSIWVPLNRWHLRQSCTLNIFRKTSSICGILATNVLATMAKNLDLIKFRTQYDLIGHSVVVKNVRNKKLSGVCEHSNHFPADLFFSLFKIFE